MNIERKEWEGFNGRIWKEEVNVRDFIQNNYKPYDGDESFLAGPTEATDKLWGELQKLQKEERAKGGVLDMETEVVSSLTAYGPGYIKEELKDLEKVVGLQTDKPLKRAFMPYGGIKMAEEACTTYGYQPSEKLHEIFTKYHKTHNQAVFDAYTPEMRLARRNKIVTGLPDTYGRGRIVGDYRRVALYGIDYLIEEKEKDKANCGCGVMSDDVIRQREELAEQIKALKGMKEMADLLFAMKVVKHTKSNAIVVAKNGQSCGIGAGQTNRIWAAAQAIEHAGDKIEGCVLASDAFFPFSDCVEEAHKAGITAIIQPGGSIRDQESIDACNRYGIAMVFTGIRHFKH